MINMNGLQISKPFFQYGSSETAVKFSIEIDMNDRREYPADVEFLYDREQLIALHEHLGNIIYEMKRMEDGSK